MNSASGPKVQFSLKRIYEFESQFRTNIFIESFLYSNQPLNAMTVVQTQVFDPLSSNSPSVLHQHQQQREAAILSFQFSISPMTGHKEIIR